MKAAYYILALCVLALTGGVCVAGTIITEAQAIGVAKKAAAPYCENVEQCVVTIERKNNHWFVTLQVASKAATGGQLLEVGNFKTVEVNESGNVVSIAHGK